MDFVINKNFKSPYAVATGMPHKPTALKTMQFKKGQIIKGDLKKDERGKSAFILYKGTIVVPVDCVKQVVTKEVDMSNAIGPVVANFNQQQQPKPETKEEQKKKYAGAIIVGAILGFGAAYYAEKQGWIALPEQKNKIIGAVLGGLAGAYLVYRFKKSK